MLRASAIIGSWAAPRAGVREQLAVEAHALLEVRVGELKLAGARLGLRDLYPRIAGCLAELRIGGDLLPQGRFLRTLALEQPIIEQRREILAAHLDVVLEE